jgi:TM2 domain-containing membrane protein YozV
MTILNKIFGGLFSIYEDKKSSVVIVFFVVSGFGLYKLYLGQDIPNNVTTIILTLSGLIFGVNSISTIVSGMKNKDGGQGD